MRRGQKTTILSLAAALIMTATASAAMAAEATTTAPTTAGTTGVSALATGPATGATATTAATAVTATTGTSATTTADTATGTFDAKRWARAWARRMHRAARHARKHARALGIRLPASLRAFLKRSVSPGAARSATELDWKSYGSECKNATLALRRYVKKTWRRIAHPKRIINARTWLPLLRHEKWPKAQIPTALKVIRRESGGQPWAIGGGSFYGLFQIYEGFNTGGWDLCDPVVNVRLALQLYHRSGWQPWSATAY